MLSDFMYMPARTQDVVPSSWLMDPSLSTRKAWVMTVSPVCSTVNE